MKKYRHGFTLVEMLAVVALIAILAGFVFPALRGARQSAKAAATRSKIANLEVAINAYFNDFGRYPDLDGDDTDFPEYSDATPKYIPEHDNDCVMMLLAGRYYDNGKMKEDEMMRDNSRRWNGPYMEGKRRNSSTSWF